MKGRYSDKIYDINNLSYRKTPHIELEGNKSFLLSGKFSICEYSDSLIKIKTEGGYLNLLGDNLSITFATDTDILVVGKIVSLEFN